MTTFARIVLDPGTITAWLVVGLAFGWLASTVWEAASYGMAGDLLLGCVGAVLGGLLFGLLRDGAPGFWGGILVACSGACVLIGGGRVVAALRKA
jgi:uncharacterized membrane protein YeaQ/YmgE (transglycosylase-associated protein family)